MQLRSSLMCSAALAVLSGGCISRHPEPEADGGPSLCLELDLDRPSDAGCPEPLPTLHGKSPRTLPCRWKLQQPHTANLWLGIGQVWGP